MTVYIIQLDLHDHRQFFRRFYNVGTETQCNMYIMFFRIQIQKNMIFVSIGNRVIEIKEITVRIQLINST